MNYANHHSLRKFIDALFKLTSQTNQVFSLESIVNESSLSEDVLLSILESLGNGVSRVGNYWKLGIPRLFLALELDPSGIGQLIESIDWKEFEGLITFILSRWGYSTFNNVRFRLGGALMEIDVIGAKKNRFLLIEAKRWRKNAMKGVAEVHLRKAELIRDNWMSVARKLGLPLHEVYIYPLIVSWKREEEQMAVPVIDVRSLNGLMSVLDSSPSALPSLRASMSGLDL